MNTPAGIASESLPPSAPDQLSTAAVTGTGRYRTVLRQLELRLVLVFPDINLASRALRRLSNLSEDMRILSLNAELVAGRAGRRGLAVRALTQYTRGLVTSLQQITGSASAMRTLYEQSTAALRTLRHLRQIEAAHANLGTALAGGFGQHAASALGEARLSYIGQIVADLEDVTAGVARLGRMVRVVDDVVEQASSIATNIAAEAVAVGAEHQEAFTAVAETMRSYVEELQVMSDEAAKGVRGAIESCDAMRAITGQRLRPLLTVGCAPTVSAAA